MSSARRNITGTVSGVILVLISGGTAAAANAETLILRSGVTIVAPVLRQDQQTVIVDMGHDLLRLPRAEITAIDPAAPVSGGDLEPAPTASAGYSVAGAGTGMTTADAVRRFAPAVVLVRTPRGLGSGFLINRQGKLITNFHVIAGSRRISVTQFQPGEKGFRQIVHQDVEIVATAPFYDLAVLRIKSPATPFEPAVFPARDDVRAGERIFVIGNPMGLEQTVTEGVVSQPHRNYRGVLWRQIDAPVNPGNSGGPLFNQRGEVIGVINARIPFMDGLGFAIPVRHVMYVLDHLDAFAFNAASPESGFVYPDPPPRPGAGAPATGEEN